MSNIISGHTAYSSARNLLDENGMADIQIKPATYLRSILYGNCYSKRNKTIYLRRNIINSTSPTAIAVACNKVGLVMQDKEGGNFYKFRAMLCPYVLFSSYVVAPLVLLAVFVDIMSTISKVCTTISVIISTILYILLFLYLILTIPVFSRANKLALELLGKYKHLNDAEMTCAKKLYTSYVLSYVFEFVISLLLLIKSIFVILMLII